MLKHYAGQDDVEKDFERRDGRVSDFRCCARDTRLRQLYDLVSWSRIVQFQMLVNISM